MITGTTEELLAMLVELSGPCPEICDGTIPLGGSGGTQVVDIRTGIPVTEYPSPSTFLFKDLGFTISSTDFSSFGYGGGVAPIGTSGFTTDGLQSAGISLYSLSNFVGGKDTEIQTYFTDNSLLTSFNAYIFNATWGPGSSTSSNKVIIGFNGTYLYIAPIYTGDNNWQTPGQNNSSIDSVAGTWKFPATFSLYIPTTQQGNDWC